MIEIIIVVLAFAIIGACDMYSTAKLMKYNHKMTHDLKFRRKMLRKIYKVTKKDVTKTEMSKPTGALMRKYGIDRALLYIGVFGYGTVCLALFYMLLIEPEHIIYYIIFLAFLTGLLYKQVWKAVTLKKNIGINIWKEKL